MSGLESGIATAQRLILEAAFDARHWEDALNAVADACGGSAGQLISVSNENEVTTHLVTRMPEGFQQDIEAFGLANALINPRMRLGRYAPLMQLVADQDHVAAADRASYPIYSEYFEPHDVAHNCQVVLRRSGGGLTRSSVSRTRRQGPFDARSLKAFEALAPSLQAAIRFGEGLAAARTDGYLEACNASGAIAFLLDMSGQVTAMSRAAEAWVLEGSVIRMRARNLIAVEGRAADRVAQMVARARRAATARRPLAGDPVLIRDETGTREWSLEVQPIATEMFHVCGSAAMLVLVKAHPRRDLPAMLTDQYGLTASESAVASQIARGFPLARIADERSVRLTTVRSQLQSIYGKLGVTRQAELVALLHSIQSSAG